MDLNFALAWIVVMSWSIIGAYYFTSRLYDG
jgi:hypothetical protein